MSGARFFLDTMKMFNDMEFRKEQALRDEQFRRDQLTERSRQFDISAKHNADVLDYRRESDKKDRALRGRSIAVAESAEKRNNLVYANEIDRREKQQKANVLQTDEIQEREALEAENNRVFNEGFARLRSGEMVDVSLFAFGENVDPSMLNGARGNSGRGSGVFLKYNTDNGRHEAFTKDQETGEYLPFTTDPEDNDSPQLYFEDDNIMESLFTITGARERIEQEDKDGSIMSAFYSQNMGLVTDDNGRVITRRRANVEAEARAEFDARNALNEKKTTKASKTEDEPSPIINGREGGLVDDAIESVSDRFSISPANLIPGYALTRLISPETADRLDSEMGEVDDSAMNSLFGEKTKDVAKKVKGKSPEQAEKVIFSEYLKQNYGSKFKGSERAFLSAMRPNSQMALDATEDKRRQAFDLMNEAGMFPDAQSLARGQSYIKNGTMLTEAEMEAAGLKNAKELLDIRKTELEVAKLRKEVEGTGAIPVDKQLKFMTPMVERAVGAATSTRGTDKGASFTFNREKDKLTTAWSTWMVSSKYQFDGSWSDQELITAGTKVYYALNDVMRENNMSLDSVDAAVAIAAKFPQLIGNPDALEDKVTEMVYEAKSRDVSVDVIGREWLVK